MKEHDKLIEGYCLAIKNHFRDRLISICLFGSVARGEAKAESDIDILVIAEALPVDVGMRIKETNYIHENLKRSEGYILFRSHRSALISDIFFIPEEIEKHPPILLDIVDEGVIFYDRNSFLSNTLKRLKERLELQKARKVKTRKGHFWILKDVKPGEVVEI